MSKKMLEENYAQVVNYVIGLRADEELSKINPKKAKKGLMKIFNNGAWDRPRAHSILEETIRNKFPQYQDIYDVISLLK